MLERFKLYHTNENLPDRVSFMTETMPAEDGGESWRYEFTHEDGKGKYDLFYRQTNLLADPEIGPGDMPLRDWLAGQSIGSAVLAAPEDFEQIAKDAYKLADAMLKAREAQQ